MGKIDQAFMDMPPEVLTTSMRANQKYFALLDKSGKLAPRFLVVVEHGDQGRRQGRSSPATSACCARGCPTPSSSGTRTAR